MYVLYNGITMVLVLDVGISQPISTSHFFRNHCEKLAIGPISGGIHLVALARVSIGPLFEVFWISEGLSSIDFDDAKLRYINFIDMVDQYCDSFSISDYDSFNLTGIMICLLDLLDC